MRNWTAATVLMVLLAGGTARAGEPGVAVCVSTRGLSPEAAANLAGLVTVTVERQGFRLATGKGEGSFEPECCDGPDCIRQKAAEAGAAGVLNIQLFQIGPALRIGVKAFDADSGAMIRKASSSVGVADASGAVTAIVEKGLEALKPKKGPAEGFLIAVTRPPANILIDGEPTGRTTPIARSVPLTLPVGQHRITFQTGDGARIDFEVTIVEGETTELVKDLGGSRTAFGSPESAVPSHEMTEAAPPGPGTPVTGTPVAGTQEVRDTGASPGWLELEAHACLGGSELVGDQAGSASSGDGPDDNRVVLASDPDIRARMGTARWGGGVRAGVRLGDWHTVGAQLDYLRERWYGDLDRADSFSQDFQLVRLIATYRFHYPVLDWLAPFVEAGVGAHLYLDATARFHDATSATGVSGVDISPDARLAVMLAAGLRVDPVAGLFVTFSYLWDVPVDRYALSSSSFILGAGYRF
jgi:opacity protein-like surface antigen